MTTLAAKNEKRGFFTIYKPGQGKWVRWGTVAGVGLVVAGGAYWLTMYELAAQDVVPRTIAGAVWMALGALLTFWLVNSTRLAEFMIMTESEMRKVSWPTRREVITSTKIVIILTILLGALLFLVDIGFSKFFIWIKLS